MNVTTLKEAKSVYRTDIHWLADTFGPQATLIMVRELMGEQGHMAPLMRPQEAAALAAEAGHLARRARRLEQGLRSFIRGSALTKSERATLEGYTAAMARWAADIEHLTPVGIHVAQVAAAAERQT